MKNSSKSMIDRPAPVFFVSFVGFIISYALISLFYPISIFFFIGPFFTYGASRKIQALMILSLLPLYAVAYVNQSPQQGPILYSIAFPAIYAIATELINAARKYISNENKKENKDE